MFIYAEVHYGNCISGVIWSKYRRQLKERNQNKRLYASQRNCLIRNDNN